MAIVARDLMVTDPIAVAPETPLLQVHRLFVTEEIHGAPVVGDDGTVLGVISTLDLLRAVQEEHDEPEARRTPTSFHEVTAGEVATPEVVQVAPDTPIAEVARIMREQRIHRVLVADDGRLVGLITPFDLMRLLEHDEPAVPTTGPAARLPRGMLPATRADVAQLLGDVDAMIVARILEIGPTLDELDEALRASEDEVGFGETPHPPSSPRVAALRDVLDELITDEAILPEDELPAPR